MIKPLLPGKLYYTIGEVAESFDVNTSLIRFWEKEFEILKPAKNKKGNRLFTKEDVDNLKLIFHLVKEKGYTLQGAKDWLHSNAKKETAGNEVMESLQKMKDILLQMKHSLRQD